MCHKRCITTKVPPKKCHQHSVTENVSSTIYHEHTVTNNVPPNCTVKKCNKKVPQKCATMTYSVFVIISSLIQKRERRLHTLKFMTSSTWESSRTNILIVQQSVTYTQKIGQMIKNNTLFHICVLTVKHFLCRVSLRWCLGGRQARVYFWRR